MKGWQNYKIICQKQIQSNEQQTNYIKEFEKNPYLIRNEQNQDRFLLYHIPYEQCISLNDLIDAIKSKYVVIFKGQAILIMKAILKHFLEMVQKNIVHCQLNLNNIFIKLNERSNKFTTYQSKVSIEKIYFIQYLCISQTLNEDQINTNDVRDIKIIINEFLSLYQDQRIQQLIDDISQQRYLNILNQCQDMNRIVNEFIRNYVDEMQQTMRSNELKNYFGFFKQRYYYENELLHQLKEQQINILNIFFGDQIVNPSEQEQMEQQNFLKFTEKIQLFIQNYFQTLIVKQFQKYYGDKLENSYFIAQILNKQNYQLQEDFIRLKKQRANRLFESINSVIRECLNFSTLKQEEIFQRFQCEIVFSEYRIIEIIQKFYIMDSLDQDLSKEEGYKIVEQRVQRNALSYINDQYRLAIE